MHILVTNDDGPPSTYSSPYVHTLIRQLTAAGHSVSVILPHTQRSWIGKAHIIGQTVRPLYYTPGPSSHGTSAPAQGTISETPSAAGNEWILVDGTPASCVQIGVHHFFQERGPVDLVVSGPNYGRNTTAVFALSSGTMGAALEAAVCGFRAVALSFAFFSRNHDVEVIEAATRHSVRVIEAIVKQWPADKSVDLYSVNVPLVAEVETHRTLWTDMLQNYWSEGSCFEEIEASGSEGAVVAEEEIRKGEKGDGDGKGTGTKLVHRHKHFKWAPKFAGVYKSVEDARPGNDGWAVQEGLTSVTPLKANFFQTAHHLHGKEMELAPIPAPTTTSPTVIPSSHTSGLFAVINYDDAYVHPLIVRSLTSLFPSVFTLLHPTAPANSTNLSLSSVIPDPSARILQIMAYEALDFDYAAEKPSDVLINSYMIRKALIRKHYLALAVRHWVAKNPESILKKAVAESDAFEVDYAEFLDDSLVEAFDLRQSMEENEGKDASEREWWILKPGMSDRGQGIRLFSTMEELQGIYDEWEQDQPDTDDEAEEETDGTDGITTSHLRHFVAQKYIHPPLLPRNDSRKFHIRTYVTCTGRLKVHVYDAMLALSASIPYAPPWETENLDVHLTNTCRQDALPTDAKPVVRRLDSVELPEGCAVTVVGIKEQIREIVGDVFEGTARAMGMHFSPLGNGFEVFGVDFLVREDGQVFLLEVNSYPDFRQTGDELAGVVEGFWRETLRVAVGGFFGVEATEIRKIGEAELRCVREVEMGM